MLLVANVKSKFSNLFLKHFPTNTTLIRIRNCLLANRVFRFWRIKEWSKYLFKEDRMPYDVNITVRCRQTNPSFPYFLEWEAKKHAKTKTVTRTIGGVVRVGSGIGLGWNGEGWGKERHDSRLLIGQELDSRDFQRKTWLATSPYPTEQSVKPPHSQKH